MNRSRRICFVVFLTMITASFPFAFLLTPVYAATPTPPPSLPRIAADTTEVKLTHIDIPPVAGKTLDADLLDIDQENHRLYFADRGTNGLDVFDISTPTAQFLYTIGLGSGPNGLIIVKEMKKLFAGLNDSTVAIIDIDPSSPRVNTVIARLNTGGKKRADEGDYDPVHKKVYWANSDDGFVSVIDATTNQIIKKLDRLGEGLEQPRYNPGDGLIYMTSSDQNALIVMDPAKDEVVRKLDLGLPCTPHGIAFNQSGKIGLIGCYDQKSPRTVAWDVSAAKAGEVFLQVGAGDNVIYDGKANRYFFAAHRFNRGPHLGIFDGVSAKFITNVPTVEGAKAIAYDETHRVIYLPDGRPNNAGLISFPLP